MSKRIVNVKVLPGEPTDGSGRMCIHLFVQAEDGPIVEPHVLHPAVENGVVVKQKLAAKPTRGRLACDPRRTVAPVTSKGITTVIQRTSDPRAVTCLKCVASTEYSRAMESLVPKG